MLTTNQPPAPRRLKEFLITTRNRDVEAKLQHRYHTLIAGNALRVFCISNSEYWDQRGLPRDDALPCLHLSGIIGLRRHCIAIVAHSQLRAAAQYIRDDVPALLGDADLWVQSGAGSADAERKQLVIQALDMVKDRLNRVRI